MERKLLTLCIVHQNNRVLLGMKKRGFGAGRWNGFGGKVHPEETIEAAAVREMQEEAGITPQDLRKIGLLEFNFRGTDDVLEVHVFKCTAFAGEVGESEEMRPEWFALTAVPFDQMWQDDPHWFPSFLENKKFRGRFLFDEKDAIIESDLEEVMTLD